MNEGVPLRFQKETRGSRWHFRPGAADLKFSPRDGEKTYAKQFNEGEPFRCAGNEFAMLLPRDETGACEAVLQIVRPGGTTPPNRHETFMQIYLIGAARRRSSSEGNRNSLRRRRRHLFLRGPSTGLKMRLPIANGGISTSVSGPMAFRRRSSKADGRRYMRALSTSM